MDNLESQGLAARLGIERQAAEARAKVESQEAEAARETEAQATAERQKTSQQAEANRATIRQNIGQAESQLQSQLQAARNQQAMIQRQRAVGGAYGKVAMPDVSSLEQAQSELSRIRREVDVAEVGALADINKQLAGIKADLAKQKETAFADIGKQEQEALRVQAELLRTLALQQVTTQQTITQQTQAKVSSDNILLNNGDYVARDFYNSLDKDNQDYLMQNGVDKYNSRIWLSYAVQDIGADFKTTVGLQAFAKLQLAGKIPEDAIYKDATVKGGVATEVNYTLPEVKAVISTSAFQPAIKPISLPLAIWRALTPWEEEKQTALEYAKEKIPQIPQALLTYIKNTPDRLLHPEMESQENLKAEYDAQVLAKKTMPWWYDVFFASQSVFYDARAPEGQRYQRLVTGEIPLISGAGRIGITVGKTAAKQVVTIVEDAAKSGILEKDLATFFRARIINPKLTPAQFLRDKQVFNIINRAVRTEETVAPELTKSLGRFTTVKLEPVKPAPIDWGGAKPRISGSSSLEPGGYKVEPSISAYKHGVTVAKPLGKALTVETKGITAPVGKAITIEVKEILIPKPVALTVSKVLTTANPQSALDLALKAGAITSAIAVNAQIVGQMIASVNQATRTQVLAQVSTQIKQAIQQKNYVKAQQLAQVQVKTETQVVTITQQATKLANQLQTEGATQTQIENQVETLIKQQTQLQTDTATKTQLKQLTQTIVDIATQTITKQVTKTKIPTQRIPSPAIIKIPLPSGEGFVELTEKQRQGIVAWKQGFVFWLKYPDLAGNYPDKNTYHSREPIAGVVYAEGIGSVAKSIIAKYGRIPEDIRFSMGIQDVTIRATRAGGKPIIKFKRKSQYRPSRRAIVEPSLTSSRRRW